MAFYPYCIPVFHVLTIKYLRTYLYVSLVIVGAQIYTNLYMCFS